MDKRSKMERFALTAAAITFSLYTCVWIYALVRPDENGQHKGEITSVDTVYIRDTIVIYEPVPTSERFLAHDTLRMKKAKSEPESEPKSEPIDSCHIADSVEVVAPRVQRRYDDSTCTVWVSGYDPRVDSVWTYRKTVYLPVIEVREPKPPRVVVSIGPYAGFGNKGASYGVAISVGIPIWSF